MVRVSFARGGADQHFLNIARFGGRVVAY